MSFISLRSPNLYIQKCFSVFPKHTTLPRSRVSSSDGGARRWAEGHQAWQCSRYRLSLRKTLNNLFRTLTDGTGQVCYRKSLRLFSDAQRVKGKRRGRRWQRCLVSSRSAHLPFPHQSRLKARRLQTIKRSRQSTKAVGSFRGLSRGQIQPPQIGGANALAPGWWARQQQRFHRRRHKSRTSRFSSPATFVNIKSTISTVSARPLAVLRLVVVSNLLSTPLLNRRARSLRARSGQLVCVEYKPQRAFNGCRLRKAPGKKLRLRRGRFVTTQPRTSVLPLSSVNWHRHMSLFNRS